MMVNDQISNPTTTILVSKVIKICCENFLKKKIFLKVLPFGKRACSFEVRFTKYISKKIKKLKLTKNKCEISSISSNELKKCCKKTK